MLEKVIVILISDPNDDRNCAKVSTEGSNGFWYMTHCDEPASYICEYPRQGYTVPPTTTTTVPPEAQCPSSSWTKINGQCYRLFAEELSFPKAEQYCQSLGGHLTSLHSVEEEHFLTEQANYGYYFLWIGLRQDSDGEDGGYYWTDESAIDYTPYKSGYPDSHGGVDNCFLLDWYYSYSNGWENHNCQSEMAFACKVEAGFEPPITADPPTAPPSIPCDYNSDDGWVKMSEGEDTQFCYKFVATSADSDIWSQAEYYCQKEVRMEHLR